MSIGAWLTLALFLLFFGLICPIFLYLFNRFLKTARTKGLSFIWFPEDK